MARVVIAGGGVMGWSTALFLKRLGHQGPVTVVERGGESHSSTARSAGGIRHQFTLEENVRLSMFGTEYLRSLPTSLSCSFREGGYLFLASSQGGADALRRANELQRRCGAQVSLLDANATTARWPFLHGEDVALAGFGEAGEGWLDPHLLRASFAVQAQALGAEKLLDTVTRVVPGKGRKVSGVALQSGRNLECDILVNALGPSCAELMWSLDPSFNLPVRRRKRCIFFFTCKDPMPLCPMVIDPSGVYFRPEGSGYITGCSPSEENDPDVEPGDFEVDHDMWEERLWPALAHRVPKFECIKVQSSWAGHYEYNTFDHNAIIGPALADNLYLINGFSGHGLQQSPGAGRALAELILHGKFLSIDVSRFSYDRIAQGKPLLEQNII